jgi:hypothetical protein
MDDAIHRLDESLQLKAKNFLKRYTSVHSASPGAAGPGLVSSSSLAHDPGSSPVVGQLKSHGRVTKHTVVTLQTSASSFPSTSETISDSRRFTKKTPSKFESLRSIPPSNGDPPSRSAIRMSSSFSSFSTHHPLPPSKLMNCDVSEEVTEEQEHEAEAEEESQLFSRPSHEEGGGVTHEDGGSLSLSQGDTSRVDDVIYKPLYQMDLKKTSQMAAHLQRTLMGRPSSSTGVDSHSKSHSQVQAQAALSSLRLSRSSSALPPASAHRRPLSGNDATRRSGKKT